jgi:hypothetical protein
MWQHRTFFLYFTFLSIERRKNPKWLTHRKFQLSFSYPIETLISTDNYALISTTDGQLPFFDTFQQ